MINFIFCQQISTALSSHVLIHGNFQAKIIQLIYNFNPLWINTALKRTPVVWHGYKVSIPYGLTLLSNTFAMVKNLNVVSIPYTSVSIPYGLTLLSNKSLLQPSKPWVSIPYGLTLLSNHAGCAVRKRNCFNPLWINTALKPKMTIYGNRQSFNPLWINTALKLTMEDIFAKSVSIPYGLTLLSNGEMRHRHTDQFQSPMD